MESLLTLPLAGEARVRILQITDTHLFAQKHEALLGVNTWESYQAVLEAIRPHQHEFDLIVATGDLAQDQSSAPISISLKASQVFVRLRLAAGQPRFPARDVQRVTGCGYLPGEARVYW